MYTWLVYALDVNNSTDLTTAKAKKILDEKHCNTELRECETVRDEFKKRKRVYSSLSQTNAISHRNIFLTFRRWLYICYCCHVYRAWKWWNLVSKNKHQHWLFAIVKNWRKKERERESCIFFHFTISPLSYSCFRYTAINFMLCNLFWSC